MKTITRKLLQDFVTLLVAKTLLYRSLLLDKSLKMVHKLDVYVIRSVSFYTEISKQL